MCMIVKNLFNNSFCPLKAYRGSLFSIVISLRIIVIISILIITINIITITINNYYY